MNKNKNKLLNQSYTVSISSSYAHTPQNTADNMRFFQLQTTIKLSEKLFIGDIVKSAKILSMARRVMKKGSK